MCFWSHSLSPLLLPVASQPLLSLSPQNCPESSLPGHVPHNVTPELLVMLTCALWAWSVLVPLSAPKLGARCCQQVPARSGAVAWLVTSCAVTSDGTGHQWGCSTGQLGWGYGSGWMEGGTAPGSSRISTVPSPAERWLVLVCRAGSRGSLRCREQAGIPSHPLGVPLTWFGGALARCLPFPWRRAASPALLCLDLTEQSWARQCWS